MWVIIYRKRTLSKPERLAKMRSLPAENLSVEFLEDHSLFLYAGSISFITLTNQWGVLLKGTVDGVESNLLIAVGIISLVCSTHLAVSFVNWIGTLLVRPSLLPRMDFSKGIPRRLQDFGRCTYFT